jgi:hypothetical protein
MIPALSFVPRPEMDLGDRRFQPARPHAAPPLSVPKRSASQPSKPSSAAQPSPGTPKHPSTPTKPQPNHETSEAENPPPDISVRRG